MHRFCYDQNFFTDLSQICVKQMVKISKRYLKRFLIESRFNQIFIIALEPEWTQEGGSYNENLIKSALNQKWFEISF